MRIFITDAIKRLRPGACWSLHGDHYADLEWIDDQISKPTQKEVDDMIVIIEQEWQSTKYRESRAPEYPPIGDQLDDLFHAGAFSPEMAAKIQAIKDKYPKG